MNKDKNIPFKNYILLAAILIITIVLVSYFYILYGTVQKEQKYGSTIKDDLQIINYNEIDDFLIENENTVIYLSTANNQKILNFEKKLKKIINNSTINNNILYLNLNSNEINEAQKKFNIENIPTIIIFEEGKQKSTFDVKEKKYNINLFKKFLVEEGIIDD